MTPWELAKETEHSHQRAFFAWATCAEHFGLDIANDRRGYSVSTRPILQAEMAATNWIPSRDIPELAFMYAIPNGGKRDPITANKLKAEGVKRGAPDVCLPIPKWRDWKFEREWQVIDAAGLYIEFKKPSAKPKNKGAGGVRESQTDYHKFLRSQHYRVEVVYSWIEAANVVMNYMGDVRVIKS